MVSQREREVVARQAAALAAEESDDEGTAAWRATVIEAANRDRAARGTPPLKEWWEDKPELEFYERARALGLLARVR